MDERNRLKYEKKRWEGTKGFKEPAYAKKKKDFVITYEQPAKKASKVLTERNAKVAKLQMATRNIVQFPALRAKNERWGKFHQAKRDLISRYERPLKEANKKLKDIDEKIANNEKAYDLVKKQIKQVFSRR